MPLFEDLKVFSGTAHPKLAQDICSYLGISLGSCEVFKFSNDETFVKILENVRKRTSSWSSRSRCRSMTT